MPERALERVLGQLGDLPGHFDTGGAGSDDGERQQLLAALRIIGPFGLLEGAQNPSAELQGIVDGLHAGREFGEVVVAEVRLAGAGCDDQAVKRGFVAVAEQLRDHALVGQVDVGDVAEQHLDVALVAQHDAGRWGDFALRDDPGGDLIEQRLEQVMGGPGDQLDVDVGPLELLCRIESAEARSDDHHLMTTVGFTCGFWLGTHVPLLLTELLDGRIQLAANPHQPSQRSHRYPGSTVCNQPHWRPM